MWRSKAGRIIRSLEHGGYTFELARGKDEHWSLRIRWVRPDRTPESRHRELMKWVRGHKSLVLRWLIKRNRSIRHHF